MRFEELTLPGAFRIDVEERVDERGLFARTFCTREFAEHRLAVAFVQCNTSYTALRGTLRGMHFQADPKPEVKVVRCTSGAIYDVLLDLRPRSPSFCKWQGFELSAENRVSLYIPAGFAHGFQTLSDDAEVLYYMSEYYHADLARGVRWNDPSFGIDWPLPSPMMSARDMSYADFYPT